jgi:hypothetical protein
MPKWNVESEGGKQISLSADRCEFVEAGGEQGIAFYSGDDEAMEVWIRGPRSFTRVQGAEEKETGGASGRPATASRRGGRRGGKRTPVAPTPESPLATDGSRIFSRKEVRELFRQRIGDRKKKAIAREIDIGIASVFAMLADHQRCNSKVIKWLGLQEIEPGAAPTTSEAAAA